LKARIVLLPGDGIGPEIVAEGRQILELVGARFGHEFTFETHLIGGCSLDAIGVPLSEEALGAARSSAAVLLGAVGGPKWDQMDATTRPEDGLFQIRKGLGLYANIRPVRAFTALASCSPLRPERTAGTDLVMVRELTGGLYFGRPQGQEVTAEGRRALDTLVYTEGEIQRVIRRAFEMARTRRKKVTSVDKANVLCTSRLWRQIADEVAREYPDVQLEHQLVDSCAMRIVTQPTSFDVIVTENMFGDILSDEAAVVGGSLGILPSASLGDSSLGLYEPIHGSAPDIAGKGIANPLGTILSAAMLLRHSLGLEKEASSVESAVVAALDDGCRTRDLSADRPLSTREMGKAVADRIAL
jgi:3-isopropylmalate dehydrogenase